MNLRKSAQSLLIRAARALQPAWKPTPDAKVVVLQADESTLLKQRNSQQYIERCAELIEARQMTGSGPWLMEGQRAAAAAGAPIPNLNPVTAGLRLQESYDAQGAYGDIEFALNNIEWSREINLGWVEFSRWGIQQIILITRLYYLKNPIMRRLIDVCAAYVFARGVEISSPDEDAQAVLKDFFESNKSVLGQGALMGLERSKDTDGNLFFVFFPDTLSSGTVKLRTIDALEIMDIYCDPEDSDTPWFYRRTWTARTFNTSTGQVDMRSQEAYYPALGYEPEDKPETINSIEVRWKNPVYHRKCGAVAKWHFGAPRMYPALDWAKSCTLFLEHCATVKKALASISMTLTTKGGQQAIEGMKQQLQTTVNAATNNAAWDQNPPPVDGAVFASGPGTELKAFNISGAGGNPEEVRQYKLQCCMVKGVPECYDEQTEVLTDRGFIFHRDWTPGTKVACFNSDSLAIEWHAPEELRTFDYEGPMVHFQSRQVDILVTPNHRMWCSPAQSEGWAIRKAEELLTRNTGRGWTLYSHLNFEENPLGALIDTPIGRVSTTDWAEFLGYWISEGCATQSVCKSGEFRVDGTPIMRTFRRVMLAQKTPEVLGKMRACLTRLGLKFTEVIASRGVTNLVIYNKILWLWLRENCGGGAKTKRFPSEFLQAEETVRRALFDALMDGDGKASGFSQVYSSISAELADQVQVLANSLGFGATITSRASSTENDLYLVWIKSRITHRNTVSKEHTSTEDYDGKVYCFSVPTGIYVTRRKGCLAIQGNTFLSDVSTGNLATATSLDRPTETIFLELQEAWVEDLTVIARYVLSVSMNAPSGQFAEALRARQQAPASIRIAEMARSRDSLGRLRWHPMSEAQQKKSKAKTVEIRVEFPAIREGDIPALVGATTEAMTLGNKGGQVVGIDAKAGARKLGDLLGIPNNDELIEEMFPEGEYDPDRTKEPLPAPIPKLMPAPGGEPEVEDEPKPPGRKMLEAAKALREAAGALR